MTTGRIHSEESFGALDGPGLRYVVFLQGCPLRCAYCHNPDSWEFGGGIECEVNELYKRINGFRSFISGVTLSGGEPLAQSRFCEELLKLCKVGGLHTAVDTSGVMPLTVCEKAVRQADLILLDIKSPDEKTSLELTGRSNKNTISLLDWCEKNNKPVWIRHVLIDGYTLDDERLEQLGRFLSGYSCIERVELLPFHKMGEYKWRSLNLGYRLYDTAEPTAQQVQRAKEIIGRYEKRVR